MVARVSYGYGEFIDAWLDDDVPEVVRCLTEVPCLPSLQVARELLTDTQQQLLSGSSGALRQLLRRQLEKFAILNLYR